jgi:hypothetical protein
MSQFFSTRTQKSEMPSAMALVAGDMRAALDKMDAAPG